MLYGRPEPGQQQTREQARESTGHSRGEEAQRGDGGPRREESRLPPTLGEDAGGDLPPAMPPLYTLFKSPAWAKFNPNSALQMGRST